MVPAQAVSQVPRLRGHRGVGARLEAPGPPAMSRVPAALAAMGLMVPAPAMASGMVPQEISMLVDRAVWVARPPPVAAITVWTRYPPGCWVAPVTRSGSPVAVAP